MELADTNQLDNDGKNDLVVTLCQAPLVKMGRLSIAKSTFPTNETPKRPRKWRGEKQAKAIQ